MKELTTPMQQTFDAVDVMAFARAAGLELDGREAREVCAMLRTNPATRTWAARVVDCPTADMDVALTRALIGFLVLGEHVLWSVERAVVAQEANRRVRAALATLGSAVEGEPNRFDVDGVPVKIRNANGGEGAERLDTGAQIRFISRRIRGASRGYTADLLVVDELRDLTAAQHDELLPTVASRPEAQTVYIGAEGKSW